MFQTKLANKKSYKANIDEMRLKLAKLQKLNKKTQKLKATVELIEGWKDIDKVLHYQGLSFIPKIIKTKLISWYYNNPLAGYFDIDKTKKFTGRKYY